MVMMSAQRGHRFLVLDGEGIFVRRKDVETSNDKHV